MTLARLNFRDSVKRTLRIAACLVFAAVGAFVGLGSERLHAQSVLGQDPTSPASAHQVSPVSEEPAAAPQPIVKNHPVLAPGGTGDAAWNPDFESAGDGYVDEGGGDFFGFLHHRIWFQAEALLWWTKGTRIPPLLSTGALDQAGTEVLLGNKEFGGGFQGGERLSLGIWLDGCEEIGAQLTYFGLPQQAESFNITSNGNPALVRPFFDVGTGTANGHVIASPGVQQGNFTVSTSTRLDATELLLRRAIVRGGGCRIDMLAGYRHQELRDVLDINDLTTTVGGFQSIRVFDSFHARNEFNGGELGFAAHWRAGGWSFGTDAKVGLGNTHSRISIDGSTATTVNGQTNTSAGGLLALPVNNVGGNMGVHNSNQFSMVPEIGVSLGCDLTCRLKATVGYTITYWSNVARAGDQIDLNVNPLPAASEPQFVLRTNDYWAQGLNLGLECCF